MQAIINYDKGVSTADGAREAPVMIVKWLVIMMPFLSAAIAVITAKYNAYFNTGNDRTDVLFIIAEGMLFMAWITMAVIFLKKHASRENKALIVYCIFFFSVFSLLFNIFCEFTGITAGLYINPAVFIIYALAVFVLLPGNTPDAK
jgi:hypothetical protein